MASGGTVDQEVEDRPAIGDDHGGRELLERRAHLGLALRIEIVHRDHLATVVAPLMTDAALSVVEIRQEDVISPAPHRRPGPADRRGRANRTALSRRAVPDPGNSGCRSGAAATNPDAATTPRDCRGCG